MQGRASDSGTAGRAGTMPAARDPQIAVAEEFQLARKAGTVEALELFRRRHPDDPLAARARGLIEQIEAGQNNR